MPNSRPLAECKRHDVDPVLGLDRIGVHDQRDVLEEAGHGLELAHRAHQLLEVLEPPLRLRAACRSATSAV